MFLQTMSKEVPKFARHNRMIWLSLDHQMGPPSIVRFDYLWCAAGKGRELSWPKIWPWNKCLPERLGHSTTPRQYSQRMPNTYITQLWSRLLALFVIFKHLRMLLWNTFLLPHKGSSEKYDENCTLFGSRFHLPMLIGKLSWQVLCCLWVALHQQQFSCQHIFHSPSEFVWVPMSRLFASKQSKMGTIPLQRYDLKKVLRVKNTPPTAITSPPWLSFFLQKGQIGNKATTSPQFSVLNHSFHQHARVGKWNGTHLTS